METIVMVLFVLMIILIIAKAGKRKQSVQGSRYKNGSRSESPDKTGKPAAALYVDSPLPEFLGIQPNIPLEQTVDRLEKAFAEEFKQKLVDRMKSRYPQMTQAEYEWKLVELKRYFLMTAIIKDVPMFSQAVDELWHEMLMFTREYYRFGEAFIGAPIHHAPHTDHNKPDPGGRAWFDWVYAQLFIPTRYSAQIWNPFFRHPLNPGLLEELRVRSEDELTTGRFNRAAAERFPEIRETVSLLIRRAKEQAAGSVTGTEYTAERPAYESASYMPYMAGAVMFYSAADYADFDSAMEPHYAEEEALRQQQRAGSACGSGCGSASWDGDDNGRRNQGEDGRSDSDGGNSDGGSSSGSSCSSDGGSSSGSSCSSCGGGGD